MSVTQLRAAARQALAIKSATPSDGVEGTEKFSLLARMEDKAIRAKADYKTDRYILQQRRIAEGYAK